MDTDGGAAERFSESVTTGTSVDLKLRFVDAAAEEPTVKLGRDVFTVADTEGGAAEKSSKSVTTDASVDLKSSAVAMSPPWISCDWVNTAFML